MNNSKPPRIAEHILSLFMRSEVEKNRLGDFEEIYQNIAKEEGELEAWKWYWAQVLLSIPGLIINQICWSGAMYKNYLKTALRNLWKQKGFSIINITGLATGMAICILLLLWVQYQLSYDKFHLNGKNIFRIEYDQPLKSTHGASTPFPFYDALNGKVEGIKNWTRCYDRLGRFLTHYGDKQFYESNVLAVDPAFLKMFSFEMVYGNSNTALNEPGSIVLSEDIAKKYFGNVNPIGKSLSVNNKYDFIVKGVIQNAPHNSTIQYNILVPFDFVKQTGLFTDSWKSCETYHYIELTHPGYVQSVAERITKTQRDNIIGPHKNMPPEEIKSRLGAEFYNEYSLFPLLNQHMYGGDGIISEIKIFLVLALIILIIAIINYMNLATARSANRAKEVGLRKVVGAEKKDLLLQFIGESLLFSFISAAISLLLILILLPIFNNLSGIKFPLASVFSVELVCGIFAVALLTGIVSGSYPAFVLSSFQPVKILKGSSTRGKSPAFLRKFLVVFQFCLSIILLLITYTIYQQIDYLRKAKIGFDKDQLVFVRLRAAAPSFNVLKNELLPMPGIVNVTSAWNIPISANGGGVWTDWEGKDQLNTVEVYKEGVDFDYTETMKIEIIAGRTFSKHFPSDTNSAYVINEEFAKLIGDKQILGKSVKLGTRKGTIIGVMKNYLFDTPDRKIAPLCLRMLERGESLILIARLQKNNIADGMESLKKAWQKINPLFPFEYIFFDDSFARAFKEDERMGDIFKCSAIFIIFIASMGLFGLASFMTEKRTKEIGIRKALGASVGSITLMLSKQFLSWVLLANIISAPVAIYIIGNWYKNYAYKAPISVNIFLIIAAATVLMAVLTIGYRTIKAALTNPVDSLKNE